MLFRSNIAYNINDDVMVYGTWAEGYRPGGLNRLSVTAIDGAYKADILTSYEVGMKGEFMDGRLRLNMAYYTQEWDDFQLSKIDTSVSVLTLTDNVGSADSDGFEVDGTFLISDNWDMNFGLSWNDAELTEDYFLSDAVQATGIPTAPKGN